MKKLKHLPKARVLPDHSIFPVNWSFLFKTLVWLITVLDKVTKEQFNKALDLVKEAEETVTGGSNKWEFVISKLKEAWPSLAPHILNYLVGLAVSSQARKGVVKIGGNKPSE